MPVHVKLSLQYAALQYLALPQSGLDLRELCVVVPNRYELKEFV